MAVKCAFSTSTHAHRSMKRRKTDRTQCPVCLRQAANVDRCCTVHVLLGGEWRTTAPLHWWQATTWQRFCNDMDIPVRVVRHETSHN